jgi:hypothetical protein
MAQLVLGALIAAIIPPITLDMLKAASAKLHKRLANPRRKRKQAVNYPGKGLSYTVPGKRLRFWTLYTMGGRMP